MPNKGFSGTEIRNLKKQLSSSGNAFYPIGDDNSQELVHFHFVGEHEGREVIFDAYMYTLQLHYNSEIYDLAATKAAKKFPAFKELYDKEEDVDFDEVDEEIGLFLADVIMDLEINGEVKVQEHVDVDDVADFGVGLNIGLNRSKITAEVINEFVKIYNAGSLKLDETLYSYEDED